MSTLFIYEVNECMPWRINDIRVLSCQAQSVQKKVDIKIAV